MKTTLDVTLIFFLTLLIATIGLAHQEIVGFDTRFYLFALEMWRHGISAFPTTYQQPYPDYPATSTWLIYFAAKIVGGLNKCVAVLPSAIASAAAVVATYLLGALQSRRWGLFAAGFMLFTNAFLMSARSISLDAFVMAFTAFSFYAAYTAQLSQRKMPLFWLLLLLACSFSVRGPIGLIIPSGVLCVFYLLESQFKKLFVFAAFAFLLLMVCQATLLMLAYHAGGMMFLHDVLDMEVFGRMQAIRTPPRWFYFSESMGAYAVTYPLALLVLAGLLPRLLKLNLSRDLKFIQLLAGWALIILIGLSGAADKKVRYILAITPALSLISAALFVLQDTNFYLRGLKFVFQLICKLFPLLALFIVWKLALKQVELNYPLLIAGLVATQLAIFFCWRRDITFFIAVFAFVWGYIFVVERINLNANQTRKFVEKVETLRLAQHAPLVFFREGTDGTVIKYLVNMPQEEKPLFVDQVDQLPAQAFVVSAAENFPALGNAVQVIERGKIGHDNYVVSKVVPRQAGGS